MALAEVQRVLARLYTDAKLRAKFFANPESVGVTLGLSEEEASQLARVPASQLGCFAQSLRRKRIDEISKMFPLTQRALGQRLIALIERHLEIRKSKGTATLREDVLRVAELLEESWPREEVELWAQDIARYEAASVKSSRAASFLVVRRFHFAIADLTRWLIEEKPAATPPRRLAWAFWIRVCPSGRLRHFVILLPRRLSWIHNGAPHDPLSLPTGFGLRRRSAAQSPLWPRIFERCGRPLVRSQSQGGESLRSSPQSKTPPRHS